jgi:YD repeat-containing protein
VERSRLILLTLLFAFTVNGVDTDLLVILLEGSKIFTSLGEFTFFHTLTDIPVNEGTLGVHEIELVVKTSPSLSDSSGVAEHADGALDLSKITSWNNGWWLVVDTDLETGWAPVDELDGALGLDGSNRRVDVLRDDITTVKNAAGHVLAVTWIALDHLVSWLEARVGDLSNGELLVVSLLSRDDWGVGHEREVDTWVWHQVGLELGKIDVESTIETKGSSDGGDNLSDETVKVGVGWALNVEVATADIVDSLVVHEEGTVGVLEGGVAGQDGVVWLNNSSGDLRSWVDSKLELGLLAVVDGKTLHEKGSETGTGTTTEGVEDQETLETGAVVSELADSVEDEVDELLTDGVVTTSVVVSSIFLTRDELLRVEELTVGTSADLINNGWLKINEDSTWNVLSSSSLGEEGVERVIAIADGLVRWHLTVRLNTVLEAVKLPAGVTDLATGLTNVD